MVVVVVVPGAAVVVGAGVVVGAAVVGGWVVGAWVVVVVGVTTVPLQSPGGRQRELPLP